MLAYIGTVSLPCDNAGTPGVTTQDFTVGGGITAVPVAARITVCASEGVENDQPHIRFCQGVTDGTFQGGLAIHCETGLATSNSDRVSYDDAIIRLLNPSGSYDAVGAFSAFIAGGIRILWNTIPTGGYIVNVELWFGENVQAKAGFATPPANGSGPTQVTTGFLTDHVMTLCNAGLSALNETPAASGDMQIGHTIRDLTDVGSDPPTARITRTMCVQFRDAVSGGNSTSNLTSIVGVTYRGGSLPFLVLSGGTRISAFDSSDGFFHDTIGVAGQVGPSYIYLAVSYGGNNYQLLNSVTGTSDSEVTSHGNRPAWSAMTLLTLRTGTGWSGGNVTTDASCFGIGSASMHSDVPQNSLTGTNEDGAGTTNAFSWSDESVAALPEPGSPTHFYNGEVDGWPTSGSGLDINWVTGPLDGTARQFILFLLGRDDITATGAGTFPLPTAAGTASLTFQGTGAGTFPLPTGSGTASLTFQGTGAGLFPLPLGSGTASLTFQGVGAGTFPLPTATGAGSLAFQASGAGAFALPLGAGTASLTFQATGAGTFPLPEAAGAAQLAFQGTGSGLFPLPTAAGAALLVFLADGAGFFPLPLAAGTGSTTPLSFVGTGSGLFPLPLGAGTALLVFTATGAGFFPLPTAIGFGPPGDALACEVEMEGDYDPNSVLTGDYDPRTVMTGDRRLTSTLLANYSIVKLLQGDYGTTTDLEGDNC